MGGQATTTNSPSQVKTSLDLFTKKYACFGAVAASEHRRTIWLPISSFLVVKVPGVCQAWASCIRLGSPVVLHLARKHCSTPPYLESVCPQHLSYCQWHPTPSAFEPLCVFAYLPTCVLAYLPIWLLYPHQRSHVLGGTSCDRLPGWLDELAYRLVLQIAGQFVVDVRSAGWATIKARLCDTVH